MPIIDTHAHIFPGDFGPAPAGCDPAGWPAVEDGPDGSTKLLVNGPMRFPAKKVWFDAEARLEASAASGLDAELLSPFPALLAYRAPAKTGLDLCRVTNEYIAGLVAAFPARFYGLGTLPLQDPELAELAQFGSGQVRVLQRDRPEPVEPGRVGGDQARDVLVGHPAQVKAGLGRSPVAEQGRERGEQLRVESGGGGRLQPRLGVEPDLLGREPHRAVDEQLGRLVGAVGDGGPARRVAAVRGGPEVTGKDVRVGVNDGHGSEVLLTGPA